MLKIQQDIELEQEGANSNEIKKIYTNLAKSKCAESDKGYDDTKDIIEMLCTLVPYQRTLCIADNMVVLNDKYMRDSIDMTSFKFGGKIKVLGYITNKITTDKYFSISSSWHRVEPNHAFILWSTIILKYCTSYCNILRIKRRYSYEIL